MQRALSLGFVVALALFLLASCSDDDTVVAPGSPYEDLTIRDHVLVNLELAVVERNLQKYGGLFDTDFVFHFSESAVAVGSVRTSSWDHESELAAVSHMFDGQYTQPGLYPVLGIKFELAYAAGDDEWTEVTTAGAWKASGETRYQKKVVYSFHVFTDYMAYACSQIEAFIIVKPVVVGSLTQWRIVGWYDDTGVGTDVNASSSASTPMSWGQVKDIYCGDCCYRDLTERDQVLKNLEHAWNDRNLERYDELLDADFVFFFSETDFWEGNVQWRQWGRAADVGATRNVFDPGFSKPALEPVSAVDLQLTYACGEDEWVEVSPPDPVEYPNETWYAKTVTYSLTVRAGDRDLTGENIQATFTVRWCAETGGREHWRIVLWRDDTALRRGTDSDPSARSPLTEDKTWGVIKAVYSD